MPSELEGHRSSGYHTTISGICVVLAEGSNHTEQIPSQSFQDTENESVQQEQDTFQATTPPGKVTIIQPMTTNPVITTLNPAHNGRVCSTWGNFHFKTFDGDIFHFPGLCNYIFASQCNAAYENFNIQIRRTLIGNVPTISHIIMKLEGVITEITKDSVLVDSNRVQLPYSHSGILIEKNNVYIKVRAKMGLLFMWNEDDSILLEVAEKYANQTCGLCGDFNGIPKYNEFFSNDIQLSALQFGNMQKLDGPTEQCEDPTNTVDNCTIDYENMCRKTLTGPAFSKCNDLLAVNKYIESCVQDFCRCDQSNNAFCMCNTFAEYSRQCAHAGGQPQNWRTPQLCPKNCTFNMHYQECGSPCMDTCSNPETSTLCEEHCIDGCFCPPGTVFDDITTSGCIPLQQCSCTYDGNTYAPGTSYSGPCHNCTCTGGKWSCEDIPCPGTCSVVGGSHISTYDEKHYNVHGDCTYVLSRDCENDTFTILGELRKCGLTDTETCLKMIALITNKEQTIIVIKPDGGVFLNSFYTQLPISTADVTIFRPSSFFVIVHTNFGLQMEIQVTPFMQVFVRLHPSLKGQTCGLCGNFNNAQLDDFKIISGVVEGTGAAFANTWKTKPSCTDIKNSFENPCSLSVENEKYALHWCGMLTNSTGPFAACHATVNPSSYHTNCMFDTCNCEKSEDCMCASLSAYVRACAAKGVLLSGWRTNICSKYTTTCPKSLSYSYVINSCQPTCQSLSEPDATCNIKFVPVDGCTCVNDTYMDESGKCVPASRCPCYYKGSLVPSGEVVHEDGHVCTCAKGVLNCIGTKSPEPVCISPMVYFDCKNITAGTTGAECQKSCQTLDMHCYSTQCVSGCMCPSGLVSDRKGGCITQEECPCVHNEAMYKPGEQIKVGCNTCECKNRMWSCTQHQCLGTCAVYGDGHYITFDGKRFSFNGNCEYTLVQDHCSNDGTANGTFRVITENIPCGTTGTTCSKSIKVFLGNYELILNEEHFQAVKRGDGQEVPYKVHYMGMYLVIETVNGLHLMWDKKTSIFIKLSPDFKGQVCGLCGNYDDNDINDFTTRSQSVVGAVLEFGNSWKISSSCPDAKCVKNPCSTNPYRKSWAEKQCSIINSDVFSACHPQVDAKKYYESCVTDACACDSGGDCECFCTAVAAYAQVCSEFGVCVAWRTPSICPMFCDYYNPKGECEWHYKPCGAPCMKTCRNPTGRCLNQFSGLEGCYPTCSPDKPYFNEHTMNCTDTCGCYDDLGNYVEPGKTYSQDSCQLCKCTQEGKINCMYEKTACYCIYEGKKYEYQEVIYNTTDGTGGCFSAVCDVNGTITRHIYICNTPTTTPPFEFSTPTTIVTGTTAIATATTVCVHRVCEWSEWYDASHPTSGSSNGDYETIANLINAGHKICKTPNDIECRAAQFPNTSLQNLNQKVECSKTQGLICNNKDQHEQICYNYEIRIQCCIYIPCNPLKPTTAGTTMAYSTLTVTSLESTEVSKPTQTIGTEGNLKTTKSQPTFSYNTTAAVTSAPSPTPTSCEPTCAWTPWIDIDFPTSGPEGGDMETLSNIHAAGKPICHKPEKIQCRAQNYPDLSLAQLAQNVHCSLDSGLVCRNSEQTGKFKMCFNYEVRFWCCHANPSCITTLQTTTSLATPTPKPGTTTRHTSTSPPSLAPSTHPPASTSTTEGTTLIITSPPGEVVEPTKTTLVPTTARPTSTAAVTPTTPPGTTPEITPTSSAASTASTLPTRGPTTAASTTRGFTTSETPTTTQSTPTPVPLTPTTTAVTSAASRTPTSCEPTCAWTPWIDIDFPTSGPEGGDMETLSNIHAAGKPICHKPEKIQCRAQNYPDLSLAQLAQNVHCSLDSGLVCRNSEQTGKFKMCFNYEVRFWCCHANPSCITTLQTTTSLATPTPKPGTTTGHTSTSPPSLAPSTHPPVSTSTTEGTTLIITSPPVEVVEPTKTTLVPTTARPTSTAAVTPTTPPGTTPEITPTTSAASTASTLPTRGPTTAASTTRGFTTSETPTTTQSTPTPVPLTPTTTAVTSAASRTPTSCEPTCAWTPWIDIDFPTSGPEGGDMETLSNIHAAGKPICHKPEKIQCRAQNYPDLSLAQLAQNVHCSLDSGLVCRNSEQTGKFKMCFNYEVRFWCCHANPNCITTLQTTTSLATPTPKPGTTTRHTSTSPPSLAPSTHPPVSTSTTEATTLIITSPPGEVVEPTKTTLVPTTARPTSTAAITPTTPPGTTPKITPTTSAASTTSTIPIQGPTTAASTTRGFTTSETATTTQSTPTPVPLTPTTTAVTSAASPTPTSCEPTCAWTPWIDIDFPTSGPEGGDMETLSNIHAAGKPICHKPEKIQCRAQNYPDLSLAQLAQNVHCSLDSGLVCRNSEQTGKFKMCFNYEVRFWCCHANPNCITTLQTTTSLATPTPKPGTTTGHTSTSPPSLAPSTHPPASTSTTEGTTLIITSPPVEVVEPTKTTLVPTTARPTSTAAVTPTTPPGTTPEVTPTSSAASTASTLPTRGPTTAASTTRGFTTSETATTTQSTPTPVPLTPTTTAVTSAASPTPTSCEPTCAWTPWIDIDFPTSGPEGGDMETLSNIHAAGKPICHKPEKIQCRAQNYPDLSLAQLAQNVHCSLDSGLVCRNSEQTGKFKMCFNYEVRFWCCHANPSCITTLQTTTSLATPTPKPGTTTGHTSTSPPSLAPSTHPPASTSTTEGTTLIITSPPVEVVEPTKTTLVPTTARPTSTAAVTPTTPPGTTPEITPTTSAASTASTLPTRGPTTAASTTRGFTTSETATTTQSTPTPVPLTPTTTAVTSAASPTPTSCEPTCAWTPWIDIDFPTSGPEGGDMETLSNIHAAGKPICHKPEKIQCRAQNYPDLSLAQLAQNVHCSLDSGLVCRNSEQTGKFKMCFNYEVRFWCCHANPSCITTLQTTTSLATPTPKPGTTTGHTSTSPPSLAPSTHPPVSTSTTEGTTLIITSPPGEVVEPTKTTLVPTTARPTSTAAVTPTTPPGTTPEINPTTSAASTASTLPTRGPTTAASTTRGFTTSETATTTQSTPTPVPLTPTTTAVTSAASPTPTSCEPTCAWTPWIDIDFPTSGPEGGDMETLSNIHAAGKPICHKPEKIQCRAQNYPDLSLAQLAQNVHCSLDSGLVCRNSEQTGKFKMCFNYEVRFWCCHANPNCITTLQTTTSLATPTPKPGTTTGHTSTSPPSLAPSTHPPASTSTTEGTTLIITSPPVEVVEPTKTTLVPTTARPTSTAAVTPTTPPGTTPEVTPTSSAASTASTLPTRGPTTAASTTRGFTTSETATTTQSTPTPVPLTPTTTAVTSAASPTPTSCEPTCAWTPWIDIDFPTSGPEGGDMETLSNIHAAGKPICHKPEKIQCRAQNYPDLSLAQLAQNVHCSLDSGLVCRNSEQTGKFKMCFNYEVRFWCCHANPSCITTLQTTTSLATPTPKPGTTTGHTSTSPPSLAPSTHPPASTSTTEGTTLIITSPPVEVVEPTKTTLVPTTARPTSTAAVTPTTPPGTTPEITPTTSAASTASTLPTRGPTTAASTTRGFTTSETPTTTQSTPTPVPLTPTTTAVTSAASPTPTSCEPTCAWTPWIDIDFPTSGPEGGDMETLSNIHAAGKPICHKPEKIQCRAQNYPDLSLAQLAQNVHCSLDSGLVCRNSEQTGKFKMCFNYEVRFWCCHANPSCITTLQTTTSLATPTPKPGTTTGHTSTSPPSLAPSTHPPVSTSTTEGTTLIITSPPGEVVEPTKTTLVPTTARPTSTAAVTPTTPPGTTPEITPTTSAASTASTLPTRGPTTAASTTRGFTTSETATTTQSTPTPVPLTPTTTAVTSAASPTPTSCEPTCAWTPWIDIDFPTSGPEGGDMETLSNIHAAGKPICHKPEKIQCRAQNYPDLSLAQLAQNVHCSLDSGLVCRNSEQTGKFKMCFNYEVRFWCCHANPSCITTLQTTTSLATPTPKPGTTTGHTSTSPPSLAPSTHPPASTSTTEGTTLIITSPPGEVVEPTKTTFVPTTARPTSTAAVTPTTPPGTTPEITPTSSAASTASTLPTRGPTTAASTTRGFTTSETATTTQSTPTPVPLTPTTTAVTSAASPTPTSCEPTCAWTPWIDIDFPTSGPEGGDMETLSNIHAAGKPICHKPEKIQCRAQNYPDLSLAQLAQNVHCSLDSGLVCRNSEQTGKFKMCFNYEVRFWCCHANPNCITTLQTTTSLATPTPKPGTTTGHTSTSPPSLAPSTHPPASTSTTEGTTLIITSPPVEVVEPTKTTLVPTTARPTSTAAVTPTTPPGTTPEVTPTSSAASTASTLPTRGPTTAASTTRGFTTSETATTTQSTPTPVPLTPTTTAVTSAASPTPTSCEPTCAWTPWIDIDFPTSGPEGGDMETLSNIHAAGKPICHKPEKIQCRAQNYPDLSLAQLAQNVHCSLDSGLVCRNSEQTGKFKMCFNYEVRFWCCHANPSCITTLQTTTSLATPTPKPGTTTGHTSTSPPSLAPSTHPPASTSTTEGTTLIITSPPVEVVEPTKTTLVPTTARPTSTAAVTPTTPPGTTPEITPTSSAASTASTLPTRGPTTAASTTRGFTTSETATTTQSTPTPVPLTPTTTAVTSAASPTPTSCEPTCAWTPWIDIDFPTSGPEGGDMETLSNIHAAGKPICHKPEKIQCRAQNYPDLSLAQLAQNVHCSLDSGLVCRNSEQTGKFKMCFNYEVRFWCCHANPSCITTLQTTTSLATPTPKPGTTTGHTSTSPPSLAPSTHPPVSTSTTEGTTLIITSPPGEVVEPTKTTLVPTTARPTSTAAVTPTTPPGTTPEITPTTSAASTASTLPTRGPTTAASTTRGFTTSETATTTQSTPTPVPLTPTTTAVTSAASPTPTSCEPTCAWTPWIDIDFPTSGPEGGDMETLSNIHAAGKPICHKPEKIQCRAQNYPDLSLAQLAQNVHCSLDSGLVCRNSEQTGKFKMCFNYEVRFWCCHANPSCITTLQTTTSLATPTPKPGTTTGHTSTSPPSLAPSTHPPASTSTTEGTTLIITSPPGEVVEPTKTTFVPTTARPTSTAAVTPTTPPGTTPEITPTSSAASTASTLPTRGPTTAASTTRGFTTSETATTTQSTPTPVPLTPTTTAVTSAASPTPTSCEPTCAWTPWIDIDFPTSGPEGGDMETLSNIHAAGKPICHKPEKIQCRAQNYPDLSLAQLAQNVHCSLDSGLVCRNSEQTGKFKMCFNYEVRFWCCHANPNCITTLQTTTSLATPTPKPGTTTGHTSTSPPSLAPSTHPPASTSTTEGTTLIITSPPVEVVEPTKTTLVPTTARPTSTAAVTPTTPPGTTPEVTPTSSAASTASTLPTRGPTTAASTTRGFTTSETATTTQSTPTPVPLTPTTTAVTSAASPTPTSCEPTCAWTPWIDIDFPTSGPEGGDMETLSNIHAAGKPICHKPEKIQCRAQNYPDLSLAQLAQNVHCSLDSGLVCRNSEQTGKFKMCFNYEVRFWCCHANPSCITTLQTTTSLATPTPKPGTTTGHTSTSPPSLAPSTHPPASTSTTEGTTLIITSPPVEVVEPTKTTLVPTTARPTSTAAVTPTTPPGTTPEITPTSSAASTASTLPTRGPTTAASTTRGFTTSETATTTQSTPTPVPLTPTTTAVTSAASPTPTSCEPTCAWTPWIDIDFPTSGPEGGDMETLSNIHAAGKPICHKPEKIQCRAQNYPDLSLAQLAQNVHCSLDSGLVCRNSEQTGKFKMCFNYEVRFWCCHANPSCITTLQTTTSLATPTPKPGTTTGHTSTSPPSLAPSTHPPVSTSTTEGTTLIITSPPGEVVEPTKTTLVPTTARPTSTAAVTPTTPPGTTPEITPTTSAASTASTLPTRGPTTAASTTRGFTTSETATTTQSTPTPVPLTPTTTAVTSAASPTPTSCEPTCAWTPWIDIDFPTSGPEGGDMETLSNIHAAGKPICHKPEKIQCRAQNYPDLSLAQLAQNVHCSLDSGLVCRNSEQTGKFKMCFNYEVRFWCCHANPSCITTLQTTTSLATPTPKPGTTTGHTSTSPPSLAPSTHPPASTSTTEGTTLIITSPPGEVVEPTKTTFVPTTARPTSTAAVTPTTPPGTTPEITPTSSAASTASTLPTRGPTTAASTTRGFTTSETATTTQSTPTPVPLTPTTTAVTSAASPTPTSCEPTCAWTPWIDIDFPTSGPEGGDMETLSNIHAAGKPICHKPEKIQCRAQNYPDLSLAQLAQNVHCSLDSGLVCRNSEQTGKFKMCFNYEVRFWCCHANPNCITTLQTTTSLATPTPKPGTTTGHTSTSPPSLAPSTHPPASTSTTEGTTLIITSPPVEVVEPTKTTLVPTTARPTSTAAVTPTTPPGTTPEVTPTSSAASTASTLPTRGPTTAASTTRGFTTSETATTTQSTPTPVPLTPTTTAVTSAASPTPTSCEPTCAWTPWIDIDFPTSGPEGGDMETLSNIHAAGKPICHKPEKIQCRAQNYPDLSLAQLAQNVHCSLDSGLVCRNSEQTGKFKMCFNYEVRFWCCHANPSCITTLQTTTSLATPTPKPGTTTGHTSTSPPSLAPSTHPPASTSTTEGTTLIITSPPVEVVEPTKTTLVPTTARPTSTAAVTPTTPPGTTPEITPTSSAASTASTLPTRGPTTAASTTRGFTTSETATTTQSTPTPVPLTPTTTAVTSAASPTPTSCEPTCAWTPWIDIDFPTSGPEGGDMETLSNIHAAGKPICHKPEKIQCRAQNYPDLSLAQLAQNVHCSLDSGLVCRNSEQTGKFKMCFNYEVRFWCCHANPNCITTLQTTTSLATPTPKPGTTTGHTSTSPPSLAPSTHPPASTSTTEGTTLIITSPPVEVVEPTKTTLVPTTARPTSTAAVTPTTPPGTTPEVTPTSSAASTASTLPTRGPTTAASTTRGFTTSETATTTQSTPTPVPLTPTTTAVTSAASPTPTSCEPTCAWTPWIDIDFPTSGPEGGDMETLSNIHAAGKPICHKPEKIQCRAQNYPDLSLAQLAQNVHCSLDSGLVCRNSEQTGKFKMCFNYEVRFWCCHANPSCITTLQTTTSLATPTPKPGTTTGHTSTSPPSLAPSTHPPASTSTTEGTTLIITSPPGEVVEPTKTTLVPTTARPTSTAAATPTTPPGTTPEITHTTSAASTASTLPTRGPTTAASTTRGFTTSETATTTQSTPTPVPLTPTTTAVTSAASPTPTSCEPTCAWTPWIDIDFPTSGPEGGDMETLSNIHAAGKPICHKPEKIQCRAQNYPDLSLAQLAQNVHCSLDSGLVCRNSEQTGKFKMCFNYEVRFWCCHANPNCITTLKTTTSLATTTSTPAITTSIVFPTTTLATSRGKPSISIITKTPATHAPQVVGSTVSTLSTLVSTTTESASIFSTSTQNQTTGGIFRTKETESSTASRTTACFCHVFDHLFSPGQVVYNRTDHSGCYFYALCNDKCEIDRFQGPCPTTIPSISSTTSPTTSGLSSPGSVSSTISPSLETSKPPPEGCPSLDPPRKINETWMSDKCTKATCVGNNTVVLELPPPVQVITCVNGREPVKVYEADGCTYHYECECVCNGWSNSDYKTFDGVKYTFNGLCRYVLVKEIVPKYNFSVLTDNYNCDVVDGLSCPKSIIVNYNSMEIVLSSQTHEGNVTNKIIFNKEPINEGVSKDGVSITRVGKDLTVEIPAINAYISLNGLIFTVKVPFGLFAHNTEGQCGTCSNIKSDECRTQGGQEVSSCSEMAYTWKVENGNNPYCHETTTSSPPLISPTTPVPCTSSSPLCELILSETGDQTIEGFVEGCFCPEGSILFNSFADVCVSECGCVGPDGLPREPGSKWKSNCQECVCDEKSMTVQCKPLLCQTPVPATCNKPGFVPMPVLTPDDPCCPEIICRCDITLCPKAENSCEQGYYLASVVFAGNCCVTYECADKCKVHKKPTVIYQDECKSSESIELTYCEGFCGSSSKYSLEANQMQHQCTCCKELKSHRRQVTLTCHNGTRSNYDYIYVEECQCITACIPSESEDRTKQLQSSQIH
ncbi:mucin-5B [Alligator mississippiensis]|uniref:mucin-5B n=1 Tax=Alligator mississippiensis TaxID=8496 RepID=UPI0028779ACA|nr:mucin-5B [Alligator mississippiensis]